MRRRDFITLVGSSAIAWPVTARAQQGQRVRRIGVLMSISETNPAAQVNVTAFAAGLREQGWIEGRNVQIDYRWARGQPDLVRKFAAELVAAQPDIIVSQGAPNAVALRDATRTIPIVFLYVSDPIGMGCRREHETPRRKYNGICDLRALAGRQMVGAAQGAFARNQAHSNRVQSRHSSERSGIYWYGAEGWIGTRGRCCRDSCARRCSD